jgi:hypothetical protein
MTRKNLFSREIQDRMDDEPALHHAGPIVEACLQADVHVGDPLVSAFAQKSEIGLPIVVRISSLPGFGIQALPVLIFGAQRLAGLALCRRCRRQESHHGGREREPLHEPLTWAIAQSGRARANATHAGHARDGHAHDRVHDDADARDRVDGHGHGRACGRGDAGALAAAGRAGPR